MGRLRTSRRHPAPCRRSLYSMATRRGLNLKRSDPTGITRFGFMCPLQLMRRSRLVVPYIWSYRWGWQNRRSQRYPGMIGYLGGSAAVSSSLLIDPGSMVLGPGRWTFLGPGSWLIFGPNPCNWPPCGIILGFEPSSSLVIRQSLTQSNALVDNTSECKEEGRN
jgi:hypothetical protein